MYIAATYPCYEEVYAWYTHVQSFLGSHAQIHSVFLFQILHRLMEYPPSQRLMLRLPIQKQCRGQNIVENIYRTQYKVCNTGLTD